MSTKIGLLDKKKDLEASKKLAEKSTPFRVNRNPVGTSGTQIFAGYIEEEYLKEITGRKWADKLDEMARSDTTVTMMLNALAMPLISSPWFVQVVGDEDEEALAQKDLFHNVFFKDMEDSFTKTLGEILTFNRNGYSLFEQVHKLAERDGKRYVTLKRLAYRSQRTIDKWNIDLQTKRLKSVTQESYGDLESQGVEIPVEFLVHFAPQMEGDNFESISKLRPAYGPYIRKRHYLKLLAAGFEKYAIKTPKLMVPEGKENSPEYSASLEVLEAYTSNQSNYVTFPEGWDLDFLNAEFNVEQALEAIKFENQEMVNSILASFLLLGQTDTGSRAVGDTLSDFFRQTLQYQADHIIEQLERKVMIPLLKINRGHDDLRVTLKAGNLKDRANADFATAVTTLINARAITVDKMLEDFLRERYELPERDEETALPALPPSTSAGGIQFAEKKSQKIPRLIKSNTERLKKIFDVGLKSLAKDYSDNLIKQWEELSDSLKATAPLKARDPKRRNLYKSLVEIEMMIGAIKTASALPKNISSVQLSEASDKRLALKIKEAEEVQGDILSLFAREPLKEKKDRDRLRDLSKKLNELKREIGQLAKESLGTESAKRAKAQADVLVGTQVNDLYKSSDLQYQSSMGQNNPDLIRKEVFDSAQKKIENDLAIGADIISLQNTNETILETGEINDDVVSYTFNAVLDEDTTEICEELDGKTFAANDPELEKYRPPLHHNCRSWLSPNTRDMQDLPTPIRGEVSLTKKAQTQITLAEKIKV